jgi:tetratricopeptide (TPR) repeat protein
MAISSKLTFGIIFSIVILLGSVPVLLLELLPSSSSAYNRGLKYSKAGDYDKAIVEYTEAIRLDSKNAWAFFNRAIAYEHKGDTDKALADYDEDIRLDSGNPSPYVNRGTIYDDKGEYDKAIADYNEAIRLDPKDVDAYFDRGLAYRHKAEYEKAVANYTRAIEIKANYDAAYFSRGIAHELSGRHEEAIADLKESLRLNPKVPARYGSLAWLLATCAQANLRDGPEAVKCARKAAELTKGEDPDLLDITAAAYAEAGDFEQAIKFETKYLETPSLGEKERGSAKFRLDLYQSHQPYHVQKSSF